MRAPDNRPSVVHNRLKETLMQTYINNRAGFLLGRYRAKGAQLEMTDRQARLYLLEGRISSKLRTKRASTPRKSEPTKAEAMEGGSAKS